MTEPHAIKRARERYGIEFKPRDLARIAEAVQRNEASLIGYANNGMTVWKLKYKDTWMRLVIDKTFYKIVTFLPPSGPIRLRYDDGYNAAKRRAHA